MNDLRQMKPSSPCHVQIEEALAGWSTQATERLFAKLYLPTDFRDPGQQFISITTGTVDSKEFYSTAATFWVHALYDFLEDQRNVEKFESQVANAECELVNEIVMREQINQCFQGLNSDVQPNFEYPGVLISISRMFNTATRLSFVVQTSENYYGFFWERDTGMNVERQV